MLKKESPQGQWQTQSLAYLQALASKVSKQGITLQDDVPISLGCQ